MSGEQHIVLLEYETFNSAAPKHAWRVEGVYDDAREAGARTFELNYKLFCEGMPHRFPEKFQKRAPRNDNEKLEIVKHVINNIHEMTGAKNQYWGRGYFSVPKSKLVGLKGNVKNIEHLSAYGLGKVNKNESESESEEETDESEEETDESEEETDESESEDEYNSAIGESDNDL